MILFEKLNDSIKVADFHLESVNQLRLIILTLHAVSLVNVVRFYYCFYELERLVDRILREKALKTYCQEVKSVQLPEALNKHVQE